MKTFKKTFYLNLLFLYQIIQISTYKNLPIKKSFKLKIDEEALSSIQNSVNNVFDISDPFYQDFCNNVYYIVDMTQEDKVKSFYDNSDLCNGCTKISGKTPKYPSGIGKLLSVGAFSCFTGKGAFGNIGFLLCLLVLISLFILSVIFCFCEVHFTKSLIYQRIPSNPPLEEKKENEKKEEKKIDKNEENKNEKKEEKKDDKNEEKKNENEDKKDDKNEEKKNENEEKKDEEKKNDDNNNDDEKTGDDEKNDNESQKSSKKENNIKEINYKDKEYETYLPTGSAGSGRFCYFFSRKLIQQIEIINMIYFHEKHMSYCLDISYFLFSLLFDLFITCLLYGDSSVHKQFEKGKSMDFVTIALNGVIGVIVSKIICFFIHKIIIYNPTLLNIISDSPNHKIKGFQILSDFMCLYYTRVTIYFIIQYGLFIMCMIHISGFFYRYKKLSINALISWIVGAFFIIIVSLVISLFYAICLNYSFKRIEKLKQQRLEKLKEDIVSIKEEEVEEEEEEEEEKEYQPKVNASNGEVLEVKSNLPPMRKTKKKVDEEEENV